MEQDRLDQLRGPLPVAGALAAVAGFLDAHLFARVAEVFVANMSGNVVLLGMGIGDLDTQRIIAPGTALVLFSVGMAGATALHERRLHRGHRLRPDLMVATEVVLLGLLAALLAMVDGEDELGLLAYVAIGAGALAMGVQTSAIRRVGGVAVATTYESGSVVRLSEDAVLSRIGTDADERRRRSGVVRVLSVVVVGYCGGAAAAAALGTHAAVLAAPILVLAGCSIALRSRVAP